MSTYAIDALDNFVREELPATIMESLPEVAPVYKYIESTSGGVVRNGIGRDWEVEHLFATGLAGLIQSADVRGALFDDNSTYPQSLILDPTSPGINIFPSATATPHTTSLKRILTLGMTTGNLTIPVTWLSGDALSASQIKQVSRDIAAVGQLRALTEAQSFFMGSNNTLAQIDNYDGTGEASGYFTFTVKAGTGRTAFFRVGMMIDVVADSSGTVQFGTATDGTDLRNYQDDDATYIPLIVSDVNYLTGVIKVATVTAEHIEAGDLAASAAFADDDWIVLRGCGSVDGREQKSWGLEDWIKSSGQIMGGSGSVGNRLNPGLDLDTQSQFKSQVVAVNGPLTDTVMNGYIGGFLDAYPGQSLDTIITTQGVTLKYLEQPSLYNNRMFYDRTGSALTVAGGWDDVSYSFNGRKFRWIISPMCISGTLYALKMNNGNIKRYIPPKVGGTDARIGGEVEFLAPLGGSNNIFKIAHASTGASQALLEAPFWQYCLVAPVDVKSVKLTGLTESVMN
jgi:hypothetical protein